VYGLLQRKEIAREIASGKYRRTSVWTYLVLMGVFAAAVYFRITDFRLDFRGGANEVVDFGSATERPAPEGDPGDGSVYQPEFAWIPVLVVVGLAAAGIAAYLVASRRRERVELHASTAAEQVAEILGDDFDDLRAEPDPRRAVVAAYARTERALGGYGFPRRPFEAPLEYLDRIAAPLHERQPSARRLVFELTHLFERAKFSSHAIDAEMKDDAIATLAALRDELREEAA
jgi:hypothetical protein